MQNTGLGDFVRLGRLLVGRSHEELYHEPLNGLLHHDVNGTLDALSMHNEEEGR